MARDKVKENRGACGVVGMEVNELPYYLKEHYEELKELLLNNC